MVLSQSAITGKLIVSGRMKTMIGDDPSTFNNKSVVTCAVRSQPVDKYLKMLSSEAILVPPVKRCNRCKGV